MYLQHRIKYPFFVTFPPIVFGSSSIWNLKYLSLFSSGRRTWKNKDKCLTRPNRLANKDIKNTKHFEYGVLCWKQGFHTSPLCLNFWSLTVAKYQPSCPSIESFLYHIVLLLFHTLKVFFIQLYSFKWKKEGLKRTKVRSFLE